MDLGDRKIVLGVTGGIAAYKAAAVASRLKKLGAEVHTVLSRAAQNFVGELTFREITGQPVTTGMFGTVSHFHVEHIALAQMADMVLVAPATANFLAKAAAGMADDMLTTLVLATKAPIFVAPAMNSAMYENIATQRNMALLREQGWHIIEPATGALACGGEGVGRLPEPEALVEEVVRFFAENSTLAGVKVLVTAGGTMEPIDPVRYIGNRSSGRMGYRVAEEAARRGAETVLVSAATSLKPPAGVRLVSVNTAAEMYEVVMTEFPDTDIVIKAAAVADYRVKNAATEKIKKNDPTLTLELERNPDILEELGRRKNSEQVLVGFAAETENLEEYARRKIAKKNLDFIVANNVSELGAGFDTETNIAVIIKPTGEKRPCPLMNKRELAAIILDEATACLQAKSSGNF